ncbi:MAG: tetratricopeptide repeat protein [Bacteroidetes bacterium]|nr:tetratricopeptide repeat protein [Bacteroidota bacterium]
MKPGKFLIFASLILFPQVSSVLAQETTGTEEKKTPLPVYERWWYNFTAYFNAYYNADRLYQKVIRGFYEQNLKTGGDIVSVFPVFKKGSVGRGELQKVVQKTLSIVQNAEGSDLVDDALLMMGKSYYFMGDFSPAERKFKEVISNYHDPDVVFEATLFLARTYLEQMKTEEAIILMEGIIDRPDIPDPIKGEANLLLADRFFQVGEYKLAVTYLEAGILLYDDQEALSRASYLLGRSRQNQGDYTSAREWFRRSASQSSLPAAWYWAGIREVECFLQSGDVEGAQNALDRLLDDDDLGNYHPLMVLEQARIDRAGGNIPSAVAQYRTFITDNPASTLIPKAWQEVGEIYETTIKDLELSRYFYEKGSSGNAQPGDTTITVSRNRASRIQEYLELNYDFQELDSVLSLGILIKPVELPDSLKSDSVKVSEKMDPVIADAESEENMFFQQEQSVPVPPPILPPTNDETGLFQQPEPVPVPEPDPFAGSSTSGQVTTDKQIQRRSQPSQRSGNAGGQSNQRSQMVEKPDPFSEKEYSKFLIRNKRKNRFSQASDSASFAKLLENRLTVIEQLIEMAYFRTMEDDSVITRVALAERLYAGSPRLPRLLYARSASQFRKNDTTGYRTTLTSLMNQFPDTEYGKEARIRLGMTDSIGLIRKAEETRLNEAISMMMAGQADSSWNLLQSLQSADTTANYFPRLLYASGYFQEYYRQNTDLAMSYYKRILASYPKSDIAVTLKKQMADAAKVAPATTGKNAETPQVTSARPEEQQVKDGGTKKEEVVFTVFTNLPPRFKRQPKLSVLW